MLTTMLAFGVAACSTEKAGKPVTYTPDHNYQLTVLYSSDYPNNDSDIQKQHFVEAKTNLIKTIRSEVESEGNSLVLVSGGSPSLSSNESAPEYFNSLGYDALVVSSYMFNQPVTRIQEYQSKYPLPFISANIFESETGKPAFDAYSLVDAGDLTVAVVGVTPFEAEGEQRKNFSGLDVIFPYDYDNIRLIRQLRQQADIVILATHAGHIPQTRNVVLEDIPGIDLVVGDHTPQDKALDRNRNTVVRCHKFVTRVDIEFRNGQVKTISQEQIMLHDRTASLMSI